MFNSSLIQDLSFDHEPIFYILQLLSLLVVVITWVTLIEHLLYVRHCLGVKICVLTRSNCQPKM